MIPPSLNESAPVLIVGAPRSGTTLIQFMLRSHPELSIPTAESHFFIPFYARRDEFGDLSQKNNLRRLLAAIYERRWWFFEEDCHGLKYDVEILVERFFREGRDTLPAVIDGIFSANAEGEDKRRWGDKTPYYVLHLETLLEMFPNAQVVHIVRDGRDCALSMLERKWVLGIYTIYHAAFIWNRYVRAGMTFGEQHPDAYHEVRYEDLLSRPRDTIMALCRFLGIAFSDQVIDFRRSDGTGGTPLLGQPLQSDNFGKWRGKMTPRQIRVFEAVASDCLVQKGYRLALEQASLGIMEEAGYNAQIRVYSQMNALRKWMKSLSERLRTGRARP